MSTLAATWQEPINIFSGISNITNGFNIKNLTKMIKPTTPVTLPLEIGVDIGKGLAESEKLKKGFQQLKETVIPAGSIGEQYKQDAGYAWTKLKKGGVGFAADLFSIEKLLSDVKVDIGEKVGGMVTAVDDKLGDTFLGGVSGAVKDVVDYSNKYIKRENDINTAVLNSFNEKEAELEKRAQTDYKPSIGGKALGLIAENAPQIALAVGTAGTGTAVGAAATGVSAALAFGNGSRKAQQNGANTYEAITAGAIDGGVDFLTSKFDINPFKKLTGKVSNKYVKKGIEIISPEDILEDQLKSTGSQIGKFFYSDDKEIEGENGLFNIKGNLQQLFTSVLSNTAANSLGSFIKKKPTDTNTGVRGQVEELGSGELSDFEGAIKDSKTGFGLISSDVKAGLSNMGNTARTMKERISSDINNINNIFSNFKEGSLQASLKGSSQQSLLEELKPSLKSLRSNLGEGSLGLFKGTGSIMKDVLTDLKYTKGMLLDDTNKIPKSDIFEEVIKKQVSGFIKGKGFDHIMPQFKTGTDSNQDELDAKGVSYKKKNKSSKSDCIQKNTNNISININARDKTVEEIVNELMPKLELALANM